MTHTLELTDNLTISETLARSGNNIALQFLEVLTIAVVLDSAYFIKRAGDLAFIRTNYP